MWKDFFYFNRIQRIGIVVLLVLIVICFCIFHFLPLLIDQKPNSTTDKDFINRTAEFKAKLQMSDSLRKLEWEKRFAFDARQADKKADERKYTLFTFDPNTVDSASLIQLGLRNYVVSNILKYRRKGGFFDTPEKFSNSYGISPEKFAELKPYITIAPKKAQEPLYKKDSTRIFSSEKVDNIVLELNSADTTQLIKVEGIGRGYAKGIVRFRQQTGGFISVEQLRELYGMSEENFQKIKNNFTVNTTLVKPINVNTASVDKLRAHPYLNFYQAKAIYELRRKKIKLKKLDELKQLEELSPEELQKIAPYLSFN